MTLARREKKAVDFDYLMLTTSDQGPAQFRRWWKDRFASSPPHTFGSASLSQLITLSRYEQIHPWTNHAVHCSACRKALKNMKSITTLSLYFSASSVFLMKKNPVSGIALASLGI